MTARRKPPRLHVVDTSDANPTGEGRPVVRVIAGKRSEAIDEAEEHLVQRDLELFQRGDDVVRPAAQDVDIGNGETAFALRIVGVEVQHMRERFTRAVDLQKYDKRSESWTSIDCPADLAAAYLERVGLRKLPYLRGVRTVPVLRPDGSIHDKPSYDPVTGNYYDPRGVRFPSVPPAPTRADALAALDRLMRPLATLDFVDEESRSVALSGSMTAVARPLMSAAPLHAIDAPVAASGKSKVARIPSILASGHPPAVQALGQSQDETEKRLGAVQLAGDAVIVLDNVEQPIGGELLCQFITEPLVGVRVLGLSKRVILPNVATWFATGNNLSFAGDMARRTLRSRLDPACERPELRKFTTPDPCFLALRDRAALVTDILTIGRAFIRAGCPSELPPLGSFPEWSKYVRDVLIWLGCADPVGSMEQVRQADRTLAALTAVVEQWQLVIGDRRVTAREAVEIAEQTGSIGFSHPDFREALMAVADGRRGTIDARRLGNWLKRNKDRQVAGKRFEAAELEHGLGRWRLVCGGR